MNALSPLADAPTGTRRVLHVDDDPEFADLTATVLEREGDSFEVETATGASEGLERLECGEFDCVVSDYDMPGCNGIEFLEAVREECPDLPFVLFTGKGSEEVASDAISAGVTDYLQKEGGTDQYTVLANRITNAVEHYRSRRLVERSEKRLRKIVDSLPHFLYVVDEEGRYLLANRALAEFHDATTEEIEGATVGEVLGDPVAAQFMENVEEVLVDGAARRFSEVEVADPAGDVHVFEPRLLPYEISGTDTRAVLGIAADVTERTERERELERYEAYLKESTDIVTVLDDSGTIQYESPSVTRILGYEPGELIGRDGFAFIHPEDVDDIWETFTDLVAHPEETVTVECRFRTADDGWRWLEVRGTNQLHNDAIEGIVTNNRDVTDRKVRERALERQNERLDEFVSIVSHDLRNPLRVAAGNLDLAEADCDSPHLGDAADALDRMDALIDDLLSLARDGEGVGALEPVDLDALAAACWGTVETGAATLETAADRPIRADRSCLRQLFENLVHNAVQHGGRGVTVTVGTFEDGFYVADDGTGIPAEDRTDVFDAGYSTAPEGTGFGLHIVQQVAEAHGWEVRATASADGGARIEVTGVETAAE